MAKAEKAEPEKTHVVFKTVLGDGKGGYLVAGTEVSRSDFPEHVDFDKLVEIGALQPKG